MEIGSIKLNEEDLKFMSIKNYFENSSGILKVSKQINDKNKVDYEYLKSKMPSIVDDRPNIYGLYIKKENSEWEIMYVGQRKYNGILERLRQHLVSKHKLTGSKLKSVNKALKEGFEIGVKLFSIRPDSMRMYYEEMLISEFDLKWNQQKHKSTIVIRQSKIK